MRALTPEIDQIINQVLLNKGGELLVKLNAIWPDIVGTALQKMTYPAKITKQYDQHVLYIGASNSVASLEISLQQQNIIDKIEQNFGYKAIQRVKCLIFLTDN